MLSGTGGWEVELLRLLSSLGAVCALASAPMRRLRVLELLASLRVLRSRLACSSHF